MGIMPSLPLNVNGTRSFADPRSAGCSAECNNSLAVCNALSAHAFRGPSRRSLLLDSGEIRANNETPEEEPHAMNEPVVATPRQLSLRLLGTADLRDENGDELRSVLVAPKRLVLLAYLALTAPNYQRRDVLLALLWPDLTTERARQALRSVLHKLRQGVGDGVVASRGDDELALDLSRLR